MRQSAFRGCKTRRLRCRRALATAAAMGLGFFPATVSLGENWVGGTGFWNVAANWDPAIVPANNDAARIAQNNAVVTYANSLDPGLIELRIGAFTGATLIQTKDSLTAADEMIGEDKTGAIQ